MKREEKIMEAWERNSDSWIDTIDNEELESRSLVTNKSIVQQILSNKPEDVLDVGCGEGWLTRKLSEEGIDTLGIDGSEKLINDAINKGNGHFLVMEYEDIRNGKLNKDHQYDIIVFNYSLFGKELTEDIIGVLKNNLVANGKLLIQTIHPENNSLISKSESGWIRKTGKGLNKKFKQSYEWYFRTRDDWERLFKSCGYKLQQSIDIEHPQTKEMISIIFIAMMK